MSSTIYAPADVNGNPLGVQVAQFDMLAGTAGTDSETTEFEVAGKGVRVELHSDDTVANAATIKVYEAGAKAAIGSREDILAYTKSGAGTLDVQVRPIFQRTDNTGSAVASQYDAPIVCGKLTCAIAGFTDATGVTVRVYIMG